MFEIMDFLPATSLPFRNIPFFVCCPEPQANVQDSCLNVLSFHPQIASRLKTCITSFISKQTFMVEL